MHPHDEVRRAGAVQLPRKGQGRRNPHRPAFPVAYDILCLFIVRLYHAGKEIPPIVYKGKRRRHRLIQYQGAGGIVKHDPRLSPDKGKVENRLPRPLPGIEDWCVSVAHGISGWVHPAAHNDPLPKALENGAVIRHLQIGFLRSGVCDVEAEIVPPESGAEGCGRAAPPADIHLPVLPGGIGKHGIPVRSRFIETP